MENTKSNPRKNIYLGNQTEVDAFNEATEVIRADWKETHGIELNDSALVKRLVTLEVARITDKNRRAKRRKRKNAV